MFLNLGTSAAISIMVLVALLVLNAVQFGYLRSSEPGLKR